MPPRHPLSLVTGASAGIGAAFARALAARGHDLVLTARRADRLESLAAELRQRHGREVTVLPVDLAAPAAPRVLCKELQRRGLAVDWLINNAGYGVPGSFVANDWRTHADFLQVLLAAPTELAWRLLPGMRERGCGRIVNVASFAATVVTPGAAAADYAVAKAGVAHYTRYLAQDLAGHGINVNALAPGFIASGQFAVRFGKGEPSALRELGEQVPLGRLGDPEEFGNLAAFLVSDAASYVTGQAITIDGGLSKGVY